MRSFTIALLRTLLAAAALAATAPAHAAKHARPEDPFLVARDAFRDGDHGKLAKAAAKLKGHLLESWVEYWRLRLRLEDAAADEVRDFLARNSGTLLADQLRRDWLKLLGKRGEWELFRAEVLLLASVDSDIACYALQARGTGENAPKPADIAPFWNAPRELPEGCVALAQAMLQSGQLGPRDLWRRFRVLVDADLVSAAKRLLEFLPRDQALDAKRISAVARAPVKFLERPHGHLDLPAERELVIFGLSRTARSDPQLAASYWDGKLRAAFPPDDQGYVWAMLATQGARGLVPEASDWFAAAGETPLADEQLAWRARIALRNGNWPEVEKAIERMSPPVRDEPVWIYWLGRAERAQGGELEAQSLFARIAGAAHFYGQLAADELGRPLQLPPRATPPTGDELAEVTEIPGLKRSLALYRADLRPEGVREWTWSIRGMDDRHLLAAAEFAGRNEVWDRAINTADRTVAAHDFSVRYPAPYREMLGAKARQRELDEPLVFALVRQESRFNPGARSSAGAAGLMQLMRSTARWAAKKTGMKNFSWPRVSEPEVNATLGVFYLRHVLDVFDGSPVLAAAAYNAGPSRARKWLDARPLEGAIYAETIPFNETRDYVKKVMVNALYYAAVLGEGRASLKARLGTIPARPVAGVVALKDEP